MEFRQFDMVGTCRVMEEAPNGDVAFRTPDGAIEKISAKTLHRRLYVSKDFILEPALLCLRRLVPLFELSLFNFFNRLLIQVVL